MSHSGLISDTDHIHRTVDPFAAKHTLVSIHHKPVLWEDWMVMFKAKATAIEQRFKISLNVCYKIIRYSLIVPTRIRFLITPLLSAWHYWQNIGFSWGGGGGGGGGTDAPNRLFMKGVRLSVFPFFPVSDLLCLRSSRSKYNASTVNCLLVFSTLQPKICSLFVIKYSVTLVVMYH